MEWCGTRKRQWSTILPLWDRYQCVVACNDILDKKRLKTRMCTLFLSFPRPPSSSIEFLLPFTAFMVFTISGRIGLVLDMALRRPLLHRFNHWCTHLHLPFPIWSAFFGFRSHYLSIFIYSFHIGRLSNSQVCSMVLYGVYSVHCIQRKLYENMFWYVHCTLV